LRLRTASRFSRHILRAKRRSNSPASKKRTSLVSRGQLIRTQPLRGLSGPLIDRSEGFVDTTHKTVTESYVDAASPPVTHRPHSTQVRAPATHGFMARQRPQCRIGQSYEDRHATRCPYTTTRHLHSAGRQTRPGSCAPH